VVGGQDSHTRWTDLRGSGHGPQVPASDTAPSKTSIAGAIALRGRPCSSRPGATCCSTESRSLPRPRPRAGMPPRSWRGSDRTGSSGAALRAAWMRRHGDFGHTGLRGSFSLSIQRCKDSWTWRRWENSLVLSVGVCPLARRVGSRVGEGVAIRAVEDIAFAVMLARSRSPRTRSTSDRVT